MPIFHDTKSIFVHITKCGGTSVEEVLFPESKRTEENLWMGICNTPGDPLFFRNKYGETGGLQHLSAKSIRRAVGEEVFNNYFKFTFVRNPYDRAVSQFFYTKTRGDLADWLGLSGDFSFLEYLNSLLNSPMHAQFQPQCDFLFEGPNLLVDFVGKLESFQEDFDFVCTMIGNSNEGLPHVNRSRISHYRDSYSSLEEKQIVDKLYKVDLEFFKYR